MDEKDFKPRWISKYIIESILQCGDMSLAYDLLLKDACPELRKRLSSTLENKRGDENENAECS